MKTFRSACMRVGIMVLCIAAVTSLPAQIQVEWEDLIDVDFDFKYIPEKNIMDSNPSFGPNILALAGQKIQIQGYVIPMKADRKAYALSQFPNASCFFCGNAGLESIMELRLKKKNTTYKTDDFVMFTGILRLSDNIEELPFVLEQAVEN